MLVLDDEAAVRRTICAIADRAGWAAITATSFVDAETLLGVENFGSIVTDITIAHAPVEDFLRTLAEIGYTAPVLLTGAGDASRLGAVADFAYDLGLNTCFPIAKPLALATLASRLARIDSRIERGFAGCCFRDCHWRKVPLPPAA
ncbi:hypothetical protein CH340_11160 [Rhodoplanes serenus]|nr:hypothetical protein CH340_11160 [Rhodoplanes serenus]